MKCMTIQKYTRLGPALLMFQKTKSLKYAKDTIVKSLSQERRISRKKFFPKYVFPRKPIFPNWKHEKTFENYFSEVFVGNKAHIA